MGWLDAGKQRPPRTACSWLDKHPKPGVHVCSFGVRNGGRRGPAAGGGRGGGTGGGRARAKRSRQPAACGQVGGGGGQEPGQGRHPGHERRQRAHPEDDAVLCERVAPLREGHPAYPGASAARPSRPAAAQPRARARPPPARGTPAHFAPPVVLHRRQARRRGDPLSLPTVGSDARLRAGGAARAPGASRAVLRVPDRVRPRSHSRLAAPRAVRGGRTRYGCQQRTRTLWCTSLSTSPSHHRQTSR